jgi:hypothetical protein
MEGGVTLFYGKHAAYLFINKGRKTRYGNNTLDMHTIEQVS